MLSFLLWTTLLVFGVSHAAATSSGTGVCDATNTATCCKPESGKYCTLIKGLDVALANSTFTGTNPCYWANLGGQTADTNALWNFPNTNNFVCGSNDCNVAAGTGAANTGTAYYGMVSNMTSPTAGVTTAAGYYAAFNTALSRYNCEEQYSHWNCDDCRKAYARWACAITIPQCTTSPCGSVSPCVRVCNEVVQKCPVTLGFTCPDDNRDYKDSGCNLMGLTNGDSARSTPTSTAVMATIVTLALGWYGQ